LLFWGRENLFENLLTVCKDFADLGFDKGPGDLTEWLEGETVANMVPHEGVAVAGVFKSVMVNPSPVGAFELLVDKLMRRIPSGDFCSPTHGESMQPDSVVDQGSDFHENGLRSADLKSERRRCQSAQIGRIGEKWEDVFAGDRKKRPGFEVMFNHDCGVVVQIGRGFGPEGCLGLAEIGEVNMPEVSKICKQGPFGGFRFQARPNPGPFVFSGF